MPPAVVILVVAADVTKPKKQPLVQPAVSFILLKSFPAPFN
ncbi:hypothetical protein US8_00592 [Bacillus altitudinis]|nr:hypothetical protein US8_00592 [Bacillus altitudinis]